MLIEPVEAAAGAIAVNAKSRASTVTDAIGLRFKMRYPQKRGSFERL